MFVFAVFTGRLCAYKRPVNICMSMCFEINATPLGRVVYLP